MASVFPLKMLVLAVELALAVVVPVLPVLDVAFLLPEPRFPRLVGPWLPALRVVAAPPLVVVEGAVGAALMLLYQF